MGDKKLEDSVLSPANDNLDNQNEYKFNNEEYMNRVKEMTQNNTNFDMGASIGLTNDTWRKQEFTSPKSMNCFNKKENINANNTNLAKTVGGSCTGGRNPFERFH